MKRERYRNFRVLPRLKRHFRRGRTPFQIFGGWSEKKPRDFKGLKRTEVPVAYYSRATSVSLAEELVSDRDPIRAEGSSKLDRDEDAGGLRLHALYPGKESPAGYKASFFTAASKPASWSIKEVEVAHQEPLAKSLFAFWPERAASWKREPRRIQSTPTSGSCMRAETMEALHDACNTNGAGAGEPANA